MLALEVLGAVLADDLDAGLGQDGHVLEGHVLRRGGGSRQRATRATTPWRPVTPRSRRCEKNSSGWQDVQRSVRSTEAAPASARSAAVQRSRVRPRTTSGP